MLDFLVGDIEAAKARRLAAGCRIVEEDPSVPRCTVRDPFGPAFNLGRG